MKSALQAVVVSASLLAAQDVTFKTSTQLVVVNVTAKDKNGNAVEGLTAGDFTVLEDGKPQKIVAFEYERLRDDPLPATLDPRTRLIAAAPVTRAESRYKDRRLLVIFFDQASMGASELWRAQDAALKFLRDQMTISDIVAIMGYSNQLEILQEFTADRDQLTRAVRSLTVRQDGELGDDSEFSVFNTDRKLAALESVVRMLGSLPERKALVYFAAGSGGTGAENRSQLRSTINAAHRANVVFYPVDARGLMAQAPLGNASLASPGGTGMYSGEAMRQIAGRVSEDETLYRLGSETGGETLVDTNDLSLGLRAAQKDLSSYYIVGYYSANTAEDGKFRRIRVRLERKIAARLEYRTGYFAQREFKQFTAADRERQLEQALLLDDPITELPIAIEVDYFRLERERYFVPVAVKIPGADIQLPKDGGMHTRLDFIAQIRRENGSVAAAVRDNVDIRLKGDAAAQLANRDLQYETGFSLPAGTYTLKFLARENETGKMGTFETKFVIPDLTAEQIYLPISSVILSSQKGKLAASADGGAQRGKPPHHPLVQDGEKIVPSVTRVFRRDRRLHVYLEAYQPATDVPQPLTVIVGFYRGKAKAFESEPLRVTGSLHSPLKAVPVGLSVPLESLEPGRYTCQVSVMAPTADKFAFWRASIFVVR